MSQRSSPRVLSFDEGPSRDPLGDLGTPLEDVAWLGPWIQHDDDPADLYVRRETIELAFIAALQHLPPNQRAVLILRDVLSFAASDVATTLDTSIGSVTSALQRARATMKARTPTTTRRADTVTSEQLDVVNEFLTAFERGDVAGITRLLARDVRFTMPPLPAWFEGRSDVAAFFEHRSLTTPWRIDRRLQVNGQHAVLGSQRVGTQWVPGALMVFSIADQHIDWIASFLDPKTLVAAHR